VSEIEWKTFILCAAKRVLLPKHKLLSLLPPEINQLSVFTVGKEEKITKIDGNEFEEN
jgi:hypothetical protein